ncbi:hypothetical protein SGL43_06479 [Streptomyces globisporus]|uniref:Uncharacterized protein n=1 Tax=Streptomyces globisporus TaxID=1908 RepID=A0ABN8VBM5_STRGL|nr:hypothetical protein SGL43_06479 [Streptomyces globisporus]
MVSFMLRADVTPGGITAALPTLRGRKHRGASLSVRAPGGAPSPGVRSNMPVILVRTP